LHLWWTRTWKKLWIRSFFSCLAGKRSGKNRIQLAENAAAPPQSAE